MALPLPYLLQKAVFFNLGEVLFTSWIPGYKLKIHKKFGRFHGRFPNVLRTFNLCSLSKMLLWY